MINLRGPHLIVLGILALVAVLAVNVLIGTIVIPRLIPTPMPTYTPTPSPTPTNTPTPTPTPGKLEAKDPCEQHADCSNNACGRQSGDPFAPLWCCPSGDTTTVLDLAYCTDLPDGSTCRTDAMCASRYCRYYGGLSKGTCARQ